MSDVKTELAAPGEYTGGDVNYYLVDIPAPKRLAPYKAEAEDIIEALGMTFAEGCAFKAIWRSCASRGLGKFKAGQDIHGVYDAEKVEYYGARMVAVRTKLAERYKEALTKPNPIQRSYPLATDPAPPTKPTTGYRTLDDTNEHT